jgi:hypothetical protein
LFGNIDSNANHVIILIVIENGGTGLPSHSVIYPKQIKMTPSFGRLMLKRS